MPELKAIAGHGGCGGIRRYLERGGRALAHDMLNLGVDDVGEEELAAFDWAGEMDATRAACGNDAPWRGREARTFKHYVISPDPADRVTLAQLRELSVAWARKHYPDHEVAIVYHDDNAARIPHAHLVVNNTDLATGRRMQTPRPLELNRSLQQMAKERGLSYMEDAAKEGATMRGRRGSPAPPRTRQAVYVGRAERRCLDEGGYSWVADIRSRVQVARSLARDAGEFRQALAALGVEMAANSPKARCDDWIYSLAGEPAKRVSGERLGMLYGRRELEARFERIDAHAPMPAGREELMAAAERAVDLNDLHELDQLAAALRVCERFGVSSMEQIDARVEKLAERAARAGGASARQQQRSREDLGSLVEARDFLGDRGLLPQRAAAAARPVAAKRTTRGEDDRLGRDGRGGRGAGGAGRQVRQQRRDRDARSQR